MKKIVLIALSAFAILFVIGCNGTTTEEATTSPVTTTSEMTSEETSSVVTAEPTTEATDTYPVISGVEDITIEKNSTFVPLSGVTAWDQEDGDITEITYNGNVNPMAEGEYTATYTVVDSDGNVTTEHRTVTVVFTDSQGPLLVGVGPKTIYVGEAFNPLDGVTANDTVDGDVPVTFTGILDIWTPGDYDLEYSAEDSSGNVTSKVRTITVSFGDFGFDDPVDYTLNDFTEVEGVLNSPEITGGMINPTIADFTYIKVIINVNAAGAGDIEIALGDQVGSASDFDLLAGENEFTVYYRIDQALTNAVFTIKANGTTLSALDFSIAFAEAHDTVAPVLNGTKDEIAYVVDYSLEGLDALLLEGVSAVDDIDGNITKDIVLDYGLLDLSEPGEYEVTYIATDDSGNASEATINVVVGNLIDSGFISDPNFQNEGDLQWNKKATGGGDVDLTYDNVEGVMNIKVNNVGIYTSAAGAYFKADSLDLEVDQWYMFSVTVKTDIDRSMGIRMGLATDQAHGWVDDFNSKGEVRIDINGVYQTFNFYFKLDSLYSSAGWNEFFIELNLGALNYSQTGTGGTTTFKDLTMYKVITSYEPPTYERNVGPNLQTSFTVGDPQNNWVDYVTFYDMSKNVLTASADASDVDMSTPGTYEIILTATDSRGESTDYILTIAVLAEEDADTEGPVVTLVEGVPTTIDQFTNIQVELHQLVEATDAVDGEIEILPSMIDDGGFDFNVAGDYTITVSVYDSSGNITVFDILVTVNDKEAPSININDISLNVNDVFDIYTILEVMDNIDGTIANENVTITGLDAFLNNGIVSTAGIFTVSFEVSDLNNNIAQKSITVEVYDFDWDESTREDLLNQHDEGPTHSTITYDEVNDQYVISAIDTNVDPWDHARLVYYFDQLETGKTYKFEFTAKADTATDFYLRIGSTLYADPWLDDFEGGLKTISITDEYVTYQMIFTVTKDMPYGTAKFQLSYGYLPEDASNTIYINQFDIVQMQEEIELNFEEVADLLNAQDEGPTHSTMTYDEVNEEYVITGIDTNVDPWDHARMVYYFDQLEAGQTYRILLTAKADQATDIYFRVGASLMVDPWIDNFTGGLDDVNIGTEYMDFELVFTVDKDMPLGNAKFQLMYGYLASDASNTIYIKHLSLDIVAEPEELLYTEIMDLLGTPDEGPSHSDVAVNGDNVYEITNIDPNTESWDHARWVYYFDQLEAGETYRILITTKATDDTDLYFRVGSSLMVDPWIDNFTGGLETISITTYYQTYEVVFTVDKDMPLGNAKFQFMYGYLANDANITIYISDFTLEKQVDEIIEPLEDILVFNDFDDYVDDASYQAVIDDNIEGNRISGGAFVKSNATLIVDGDNNYLSQLLGAGTNGLKIRITQDEIPSNIQYIGIWIKASDATGMVKFQSFIYSSGGYKEITSSLISDFEALEAGTMVYIPVSALESDTIIVSLVVNTGSSVSPSAELYFDNIVLTSDFLPVEEIPVEDVEYEEVADLLNAQDEGPTHSTMTYDEVNEEYVITGIDTNVDPWDHARMVYYFDQLEAGQTYRILFTAKADQATDIYFRVGSTLTVDPWIDNFTGGLDDVNIGTEYMDFELVFTVDKDMPLGNAKFQLMYGYLASDASNTIYIKHLSLDIVAGPEELLYTEIMDLLGTQDEGPTHSDVAVNGESVYEITNIDPFTDSWDHARWVYYLDQLEAGETYRILITTKATEATDLYFRVGSSLMVDPWIDNFTGGLETIAITTDYQTYEVVFTVDKDMPLGNAKLQFMYGYLENDANITISISEFKLEKQVDEIIEPENTAPVVTILDSDLALLSSMIFEAGESLEAVIPSLLSMIQINDLEDGTITATETMISLNGLDIMNPSMGTYNLQIVALDSEGLASNTYDLELSVVSTWKDFNDFADDAALKAWDGLYGFRTAGGGWLPASGTLVVGDSQNAAAVTIAGGTNGIRINVTKSDLETLGAEYIGLYVKFDGSLSGSSSFQSFSYDSSYQQVASYGDITNIDGGTFVFVKVSELKDAQTSVSIMVNAGSGSTGTLTIEKIVIK